MHVRTDGNVVTEIEGFEPVLDQYMHKWRSRALSTDPIGFDRVARALDRLYDELSVPEPTLVERYPSPARAFAAFDEWRAHVRAVLTNYWCYQLPLFSPAGYWRQYGDRSNTVDLAVHRWPNGHGCYSTEKPTNCMGTTLSKPVHDAIWRRALDRPELNWCDGVAEELEDTAAMHVLAKRGHAEDPRCQVLTEEFIFPGPFDWLVREVACVDFCYAELACRRNERLYRALDVLLRSGSFIVRLVGVCLVCERPRSFDDSGRAIYASGG